MMGDARQEKRGLIKIAIIWLAIIVLGTFTLSMYNMSSPISLKTFPEVPKEGDPVAVTFAIKNLNLNSVLYSYELYANGEKVLEGRVSLSPLSSEKYGYLYPNPLELGEQVTFLVKVEKQGKTYEEYLSVPPYHPNVWTSFVSFASFSTAMAGVSSAVSSTSVTSITSMAYYDESFGVKQAINIGVVFSVVLIAILIHIEVTEPYAKGMLHFLGRLRKRFNLLSVILFIIFVCMVFAQAVAILGSGGQ